MQGIAKPADNQQDRHLAVLLELALGMDTEELESKLVEAGWDSPLVQKVMRLLRSSVNKDEFLESPFAPQQHVDSETYPENETGMAWSADGPFLAVCTT